MDTVIRHVRRAVLRLAHSHYGEEDTNLTERLLTELPGILLWAIAGYQRLRQRGHFLQPKSGEAIRSDMEELSSPVTAFVKQCCELDAKAKILKQQLFRLWRTWCENHGHEPGSEATFSKNLTAAFPTVQSS